jgi:tetratricopeptide (TPR) repeat protein
MRACALLAVLAATAPAAAAPAADPDLAAAKERFEHGSELYSGGYYAEALAEFEAAQRIRALPAFHFNIARCHERLGHWGRAADEYESYLTELPQAPERLELRSHIEVLRARAAPPKPEPVKPAAPPPAPPPPPRPLWPWIAGAAAVLVAGIATSLVLALVPNDAAIPTTTLGAMTVRF